MKRDVLDNLNPDAKRNETVEIFFAANSNGSISGDKCVTASLNNISDLTEWFEVEVDLFEHKKYTDFLTQIRFDPTNNNGVYYIDYIVFSKSENYDGGKWYDIYTDYAIDNGIYKEHEFYTKDFEGHNKLFTHDELIEAGYTSTRLMRDEGFERGFYVERIKNTASSLESGIFTDYCETDSTPLWRISPHWARFDLVDDRDTNADKYTIKDKHDVNTITYNPEEKSLTMRVNTYPIYEGKPHIDDEYTWWPHLLVAQDSGICQVDKKRNSAAADRMFVEIDIRLLDFEDTSITGGTTSANFMAYFYLRTEKSPGDLIWFGLNFFNGTRTDGNTKCGWAPDSAAHQYMYKMSQGLVFGGVENSFVPENGVVLTGEEWKHVRIDVTPHIQQAVDWANRDNAFGVPVTVEDMYFEGVNIGYETWGNFDYTVEFKNFNMISYNK